MERILLLNMFDEFSMIDPGPLAQYVALQRMKSKAVWTVSDGYGRGQSWYDGYSFENGISIYSPRSVVSCMRFKKIGNYWNQTETFEGTEEFILI